MYNFSIWWTLIEKLKKTILRNIFLFQWSTQSNVLDKLTEASLVSVLPQVRNRKWFYKNNNINLLFYPLTQEYVQEKLFCCFLLFDVKMWDVMLSLLLFRSVWWDNKMTEKITMSSAGLQWLETAWREGGGSVAAVPPWVSPHQLSLHHAPPYRTSTDLIRLCWPVVLILW